MSFLTRRLALAGKKERHVRNTWHGQFHLRFVAVKRKQEVQSGQTLLGILVLLSCGVCETRNVQNGNCFGLFGTRTLRALWILDFVDIGFSHTLSAVVLVPEELASPLEGVWCRQNSFCCSTLGWPVALRSGP